MIYGMIKQNKTILAAATTTEELKIFGEALLHKAILCEESYKPDFVELLQNDEFIGYSIVYVFEHTDNNQAKEFCKHYNINELCDSDLKEIHQNMVEKSHVDIDPYFSEDSDKRTLGEIYTLEQEDPWDSRSEEEKAQDEKLKEEMNKAKKGGTLTNDSFSGNKKKSIALTDIYTSQNEDGEIEIEHAIAVKFDDNIQKENKEIMLGNYVADLTGIDDRFIFSENVPNVDSLEDDTILYIVQSPMIRNSMVLETNNNLQNRHKNSGAIIFYNTTNWAITLEPQDAAKLEKFISLCGYESKVYPVDKKGQLNISVQTEYEENKNIHLNTLGKNQDIFYRIDIHQENAKVMYMLSAIMEIIMKLDVLYPKLHYTGLSDTGAWLTSKRVMVLEQIAAELKEAGFDVSPSYAVDDYGSRIVEDTEVEVVDTGAPEIQPPRPWNGRYDEFLALGDGDIEKAWKKVKGKEFIFCALPMGLHDGVLVYITPVEYWNEHKTPWEENLHINHLITPDMKPLENSTNTWRSRSREELKISQDLLHKGMVEQLMFNLFINNLL